MKKYFYKLRYSVDEIEWRARAKRKLIFQFFQRNLPKSNGKIKVLDYGCGSGLFQIELEKNFTNVEAYGIDTSKEAIEFCKKRGLERVKFYKGAKIPFKDEFFDTVVAIDVLEHIKNDLSALKEIKRVLRKDGLGFFLVPAHMSLWSKRDLELKHFRRYLKKELDLKSKKVGFRVIDSKNIDFAIYFVFRIIHIFAKKEKGVADIGLQTAMVNKSMLLNQIQYLYQLVEYLSLRFISYPVGLSQLIVVKKSSL